MLLMIIYATIFLGKHCTLQVKTLPHLVTHWKGLGKETEILCGGQLTLFNQVHCLQHPYKWEQVFFLSFSTSYFLKNSHKYIDILQHFLQ